MGLRSKVFASRDIYKLGLIFGTIYFVQAAGNLPGLPMSFIVKNILKLSASQAQYFFTVASLAWVIKPLWGYLSDNYPIFGYRRKSYLVGMSLIASSAWFLMAYYSFIGTYGYYNLLFIFLISGAAYAFVDVVCDGLMTKNSVGKDGKDLADRFVNLQWLGGAFAGIVISYAYMTGLLPSEVKEQGKIIDICIRSYCYHGPMVTVVFFLAGFAPLMTLSVVTVFLKEERVKSVAWHKLAGILVLIGASFYVFVNWVYPFYMSFAVDLRIASIFAVYILLAVFLWKYVGRPKYYWTLIIFMFLWQYSPSLGTAMFYYKVDVLKFSGSFIATLGLISAIAGACGILLYSFVRESLRSLNYRFYLYFAVFLGGIGLLVQILYLLPPGTKILGFPLNFYTIAISSDIFFSVLGASAVLIPLAVSAKVARETEHPAILYAWFMSVYNFASMMSELTGATMLDHLEASDLKSVIVSTEPFAIAVWALSAIVFAWGIENMVLKEKTAGKFFRIWLLFLLLGSASVFLMLSAGVTFPSTLLLGDGAFLGNDANRVLILRLFVYISAFFTFLAIPVVRFCRLPEGRE